MRAKPTPFIRRMDIVEVCREISAELQRTASPMEAYAEFQDARCNMLTKWVRVCELGGATQVDAVEEGKSTATAMVQIQAMSE